MNNIVGRDRRAPDSILKDSVEGTWSKENWSAPRTGKSTNSPFNWSLDANNNVKTKSNTNQGGIKKVSNEVNSNWLLTTKYASLPRQRGGWSKIRYQLRPETSLPLDIKDTTAEASNWVSELQSSFKQMPAEAFEKPNKEFRRSQHRKQTSLPIGVQDNKTVQRSNGDSIKTMNVDQELPRAKVNSHSVTQTQTPAKISTLNDCSKNNNGMNSVKQHNDSLESNKDITDLNHNTNDVINENSIIRNETDLFDASAKGVGRLGISPLKGLSSSLKPRIYKSIGIQVGSENRITESFAAEEKHDLPAVEEISSPMRVGRVGNTKNKSRSMSIIMQGLNGDDEQMNNDRSKNISSIPVYSRRSWIYS